MITFQNFQEMFILGSAGAVAMEVLKAYELRGKLTHASLVRLQKSLLFWLVTIAFILVAGFLTWAFNENNPNASVGQLVATGMGASAILKKISESISAGKGLTAGENESESVYEMFR